MPMMTLNQKSFSTAYIQEHVTPVIGRRAVHSKKNELIQQQKNTYIFTYVITNLKYSYLISNPDLMKSQGLQAVIIVSED